MVTSSSPWRRIRSAKAVDNLVLCSWVRISMETDEVVMVRNADAGAYMQDKQGVRRTS